MTLPPDDHGSDDLLDNIGDVDPLKWLESLAARQGANPDELVTDADLDVPEVAADAVVDEPGYQDYDPFGSGSSRASNEKPQQATPPPPVEEPAPPPATPASAEPEMNPLAWLESLARRQGANPEEFVTEADMEVEEVAPGTVVDEPGYTPYDGGAPAPARAAEPPVAAEPPAEPVPAPPVMETLPPEPEGLSAHEAADLLGLAADDLVPPVAESEFESEPPVPAAAEVADTSEEEVNPLAWLESLARRQGARSEELITGGTLDVPEAAADAVADEPGYVDYSPFGTLAERADEDVELAPVPEMDVPVPQADVPVAEVPSGDDTLAWLEGLAADQGASAMEEPALGPLAGLSDEEIELRAASGELSPQQMEAWLQRQAESLAQVRLDTFDADDALIPPEPEVLFEDEMAAPAEIPSWLQEAAPVADALPEPPVEELVPEEAPELELPDLAPAEMPDWLQDDAAAETVPDDIASVLATAGGDEPLDDGLPVDSEDSWVQALDSEYMTTRQMAGPDDPDWYRSALEDPSRAAELEAELAAEDADVPDSVADETLLTPPEAAELPEWLMEVAPEQPAEDVPEWLTEEIPGSELATESTTDWLDDTELPVEVEDVPDWLSEPLSEPVELPDWLREAAPDDMLEPAPASEPEPAPVMEAVPQVAAAPLAPVSAEIPAGEAYDTFRERLTNQPDDHPTRLALARQLANDDNVLASLGQYEMLVFAEASLETLESDLAQVVENRPSVAQARRVLGDVFMRQGRLQEALATYRAALEQL